MATRAALKAKKIFEQYSKKMCTRVSIFWMVYRIAVALLVFFKPEIATAMIHLTEGIDTVMIVNMSAYTGNSLGEKVAIAFGKRDARLHDESTKEKDAGDENDEDDEVFDNG